MSPQRPVVVALIPARLQSARLPRKALADIAGLPMVVHVYRRCLMAAAVDEVYVATDSEEIQHVVSEHGGRVIMTSLSHQTGTDRIAEAAAGLRCDVVVNVQGDEAMVNPAHIDAGVQALLADPQLQATILVAPFRKYRSPSDIKAVLTEAGDALYFSRSDIPSGARTPNPEMLKVCHVVSFRKPFLLAYAQWPKGQLEQIEFNEYLRILERGFRIRAVRVDQVVESVDTPEDLAAVRARIGSDPLTARYHSAIPNA